MQSKRTEVTIETDEMWIVRRPGSHFVAWCPECRERVNMITPEEAAILMPLEARALYRQVESGLIHYAKRRGSALLVRSNSLAWLVAKSSCSGASLRGGEVED